MASREDLAARALRRVGVLLPGEAPQAQERAQALTAIASVHAWLQELGGVTWSLADDPQAYDASDTIPEGVMPGLERLVASELVDVVNAPMDAPALRADGLRMFFQVTERPAARRDRLEWF